MANYQEMEQSHWLCYEFPDKSVYYGEVGYLDEGGVVQPKDAPDANNPKNKLVRHGFGIYIYPAVDEAKPARYEGFWDRDRKNGQGKLTIPGELVYEGSFREGSYHEHGKMSWENGDSYEGSWKKGRMDGGGIFKHHEGFVLKGSFKANYYIDENVLRNPQMGDKEYVLFRKQRKEVAKQKERNEKIKHGFVKKLPAPQHQELLALIEKSNSNNRIPLVVASEEAHFNLASLQTALSGGRSCSSFDLRKAYLLKGEEKYNYKQQFAEMTRSTLKQGGALIINLDESESEYKEAFYPDLKEFYDAAGFNNNTWSHETMRRKEIHEKVIGNGELSEKYLISVWSKLKLAEDLGDERVREKLQLRLQSILPFIKIDIIFLTASV